MHLVVLMAFVVALTLADQAPLVASRWLVLPAVVTYVAGSVAAGAFRTVLSLRAMGRGASLPPRALRRHNVLNILGQCWLVAGLGGVILLGYGRWVLDDLRLGWVPLVGEVVVLAPFVVALLLSWVLEYPFYHALRARIAAQQAAMGEPVRPVWTRGQYLGYNLRHHFLFVAVPVGLILLASDTLWLLGGYFPGEAGKQIALGASVVCAGLVFLCAPLLIVRIWRTARLPDGPLRDDLLNTCRRMRLRCRDLLVWRSGGVIANAGVMGLIPKVRYVLLSDALLERMNDREIKAIFAHEAGHIVCHHLLYAMMFAVSAVVLCGTAGELLTEGLDLDWWSGQTVTLGMLALAWGVGFGYLSRRFERQSDVIAAWASALDAPDAGGRITPEGAAIFSRSLERVAELNGIPAGQRNWRHGSIASRVRYIMWLGSTAGNRREIDRLVRLIKAALWAAVVVSASVVVVRTVLGL